MTPSMAASATVATALISTAPEDREWWAEEAAHSGADWLGVVAAALELIVAAGIIEQPHPETITPWDAPPWREAAAEYHRDRSGRLAVEIEPTRLEHLRRLMADGISLDRAWYAGNADRPTPEAAVNAVKLSVRERGMKALYEPANQWRLKRCDAATRRQLDHWIANFQGNCR